MEGMDKVFRNLDRYVDKMLGLIYMVAQNHAAEIEAFAKSTATWTDRTGHARQSLQGTAQQNEIATILRLAHGVEYGKWLELANSGKYAIVYPTIEADVESFLDDVKEAIRLMTVRI